MFKNLIKGVKNVLKSPIGQIGAGLLLPGLAGVTGTGTLASLARGIGSFAAASPMLTQAGIGLLAGDKPQNVLRNLAYGAATKGIMSLGQPEGFMGGVKEYAGMRPAEVARPEIRDTELARLGTKEATALPEVAKPGVLESIKKSLINEGETDFFKKYSPLLKLGAVGATIAAAAMTPEEQKLFYDPTKNPYLATGTRGVDFYQDINPYYRDIYGMKKGGVMDFPRKLGMIDGPGNGQSDSIPAMLSDGEFVMTKQAVVAAGDGDREKGTKKMYEMMYALQDKADNMGIGKL